MLFSNKTTSPAVSEASSEKDTRITDPTDYEERFEAIFGAESYGVKRIAVIREEIGPVLRAFMFIGVFLVAYAYSLDGTVRYTYQTTATASYGQHSLLAAVNTLRSIIGAAAQFPLARLSDVFGRVELIIFSMFFYVIGTIVEASSNSVQAFCAGAVLYQIGYTAVILLVEVVIGDVTSLQSRLFFSYIPALPFLINTWVSGDVTSATLASAGWRWGIGMWSIIYPVASMFLLVPLYIAQRRAHKSGKLDKVRNPLREFKGMGLLVHLFHALDIVGVILIIATFTLILLPFILAGGYTSSWQQAHVIAMLVIGFVVALPAFIAWEAKFARNPIVPFHLLRDRTVIGCVGIACLLNGVWYMQGDYLYTVLVVAFDESVKSATRITSLYSFSSVITGVILGAIVRFVKRLKPFMIAGICLFTVAFGLLIKYRGGTNDNQHDGLVGAQVLLGIAGGMFPYPGQALIQSAVLHRHLAVITALYLASYNIGSSLGTTVSGAIWTQVLPGQLTEKLAFTGNATLASTVYGDPFTFVAAYPVGTLERAAVIEAYQHVQRLLCIVGICLCAPLLFFALIVRNPKLGAEQSLKNAEGADAFIEEVAFAKGTHNTTPVVDARV